MLTGFLGKWGMAKGEGGDAGLPPLQGKTGYFLNCL